MVDLDFDGSGYLHGFLVLHSWNSLPNTLSFCRYDWSPKKTYTKHQTSGPHSGKPPGFLEWHGRPGWSEKMRPILDDVFSLPLKQNTCDPWCPTQKTYVQGGKPLNMVCLRDWTKICKKNMVFLHMGIFCFKRTTYRNLEIRCVSTNPDVFWLLFMLIQLIHLMFFSQGWFLNPWKLEHIFSRWWQLKCFFMFTPTWGRWCNLTFIFFRWVGEKTTNSIFQGQQKVWNNLGVQKLSHEKEHFREEIRIFLAILRKRDLCF